MLRYRCENIKEHELIENLEEPFCTYCGSNENIQAVSQLYWCEECQIPLYEKTCGCCAEHPVRKFVKDVRIVFPEEKKLLEILLDLKMGELDEASVWNASGNVYYRDGRRLNLSIASLKNMDADVIRERYEKSVENGICDTYFNQMTERFVQANKERYLAISSEAIEYIQHEVQGKFDESEMFVSFSGGKDSTVVADLVKRAMGSNVDEKKSLHQDGAKVLHIFGDTTLEFPLTEEYVKAYKKANPKTPVLSSRNKEKNFYELCELVGPPSRVMRWCCTIFKTGALQNKVAGLFRSKSKLAAFQGIRHSESTSRSKYTRTSSDSKIGKQTTLCPIIEWMDFDVWLYILSRKILFNSAYRLGYARVGCWCCPNNSIWSEFLSKIHMPERYEEFHTLLVDFAKKIGKPDAEVYVNDGKWKARQGGNGLEYARKSIVTFEPCKTETNAFNYVLNRPVTEELYELFKPFGSPNQAFGNQRLGEMYYLNDNNEPVLSLQGRIGQRKLKITVYNLGELRVKSVQRARERMDCQITKYQMCMGCRACESVCRFNAINIKERPDGTTEYRIDEKKCKKCRECIDHFSVGCYMRKVVTIKR